LVNDAKAPNEWDVLAGEAFNAVWRAHADAVNRALLGRWLGRSRAGRILKTDAFDEAMGDGALEPLDSAAGMAVAVDVAHSLLKAAAVRHPGLQVVCADARSLPVRPGSMDCAISLSTLDHFDSTSDIGMALGELARALKPGAALVVTLDNPQNPVVGLRNVLPQRPLRTAGLLAYQVGATLDEAGLKRALAVAGFQVDGSAFILHCPRVLAVPMSNLIARRAPKLRKRWLAFLMGWERLGRWPLARRTGHFVAVLARKPV
jgi:SAM-dependent methyltransferase